MKTLFKGGTTIHEADFSQRTMKKTMDDLLKEHPHICASCSSNACGSKRGIHNLLVYSAIRTLNRDYIFGCRGYKKRDKQITNTINTPSQTLAKYASCMYSINEPQIESMFRLSR